MGEIKVSEEDFLGQVIQLAQLYGWRVAHFRTALTDKGWRTAVQADGAGFPDLVLVRHSRVIFAELKSEKGKVSPEQRIWIDALKMTGNIAEIWRPSNWPKIEYLLTVGADE